MLRLRDDLQSVGMLGFEESCIALNEGESSNKPSGERRKDFFIKRERRRSNSWIFPVGIVGLSQYRD